jgi:hypothetical protein
MLAARKPPSRAVAKKSLAVRSDSSGYAYAHRIIHTVCCLAGASSFVDDAHYNLVNEGVLGAIEAHNTPVLFDGMVRAFSFQGIADAVAADYLDKHGAVTWGAIAADLAAGPACPKLQSYWQFHDCGYRKGSGTCNEPEHLSGCPLPKHPLRNGRLNQTAYSLFMFIRDIADGDLVAWIDTQLAGADDRTDPDRITRMIERLVGPLRQVYGVSDKVVMMTLSSLLLACSKPLWPEVGASMIAVDRCTIFCSAPAFCTGSAPTIRMVPPATGQMVAPTSSERSRPGSMPGRSTEHFRKPFPGSCSSRSGGTAPKAI